MSSMSAYADGLNLRKYERDFTFIRRTNQAEKAEARHQVLALFKNWKRPLKILTMPSLSWKFEHALLRMRRFQACETTKIHAIEWSRPVWTASLMNMPGAALGMDFTRWKPGCVEAIVRTPLVSKYMLGSFEEYARYGPVRNLDAAWIDFNGQVTLRRLERLAWLWRRGVSDTLIVTSMYGRWDTATFTKIKSYDSLTACIVDEFSDAYVMREDRYADGVTMHQIVVKRGNNDDRRRELARTALLVSGDISDAS